MAMSMSKCALLAVRILRMATLNSNQALLPYADCVSDMLRNRSIDVLAVQEPNVGMPSRSSLRRRTKKDGNKVFHQPGVGGDSQVMIFYQGPL